MPTTISPQNPIEQYVLQALQAHGFDKLKPEDQKGFFTQFMAEAERRLGIALGPHLDEAGVKEFSRLLQAETKPEEWQKFWQSRVIDFDELVKKTLDGFVQEMSAAFKM